MWVAVISMVADVLSTFWFLDHGYREAGLIAGPLVSLIGEFGGIMVAFAGGLALVGVLWWIAEQHRLEWPVIVALLVVVLTRGLLVAHNLA